MGQTTKKSDVIILLDDSRGIYIPRDFALEVDRSLVSGVSEAQYAILEGRPRPDSESCNGVPVFDAELFLPADRAWFRSPITEGK